MSLFKYLIVCFLSLNVLFTIVSCTKYMDDEEDRWRKPESIYIISNNKLFIGTGATSVIEFRINPSSALINYDVASPECQIAIDFLGENTRAEYITPPTHIKLTKVEPSNDSENNRIDGQYRAFLTDQREKPIYDDRIALVLTFIRNDGAKVQLTSNPINVVHSANHITSFSFKEIDNPRILQEDCLCFINDTTICGRIPHIVEHKRLIPTIEYEGDGKLILRSNPYSPVHSITDFTHPVVYDIVDKVTKEILQSYIVTISSFTGIPILNINTENDVPINSKDEYVDATIEIRDLNEGRFDFPVTSVKVRGRGNSTWYSMPKKSYKLKFDKKTQLFGESKGKQWVLLANYSDKSFIRTSTAFYLGELSNLEWTPCTHFVELFLNNQYQGTYHLTEQIKIAEDRVNVSDDGYIIEADQSDFIDASDICFKTDSASFCIKDPNVEFDSERYEWVSHYVNMVEKILFGDAFLDENKGYKEYIDIDSFVDWYLINEITKNNDAIFWSSCYMNIKPGGKLKMGPIWDFDISLGNVNYNGNQYPEGFWVKEYTPWIKRMFEDPDFSSLVRERFDYFKSHVDDIYSHINADASYLKYSVVENNNIWSTLYNYTWPNSAIWGSYQNEVESMKLFLTHRMEWLDNNL